MSTRHSFLSTTGLLRASSSASTYSFRQATPESTKPRKTKNETYKTESITRKVVTRAGVIPLGPAVLVVIAFTFSLIFIASISFAFIGSEDEPIFKDLLEDIVHNSPGIVLVGDNVDVDIDEPSITVRWTILGCGQEFMLSGSEGSHGTDLCGVPSMALNVFVDDDETPTATYDPARVPIASDTRQRRSIQNLHQFDSDHVLDVHAARLYPFDTYKLTSTIRVLTASTNESLPLIRLPTLTQTSSFLVDPNDSPSFVGQAQHASRDLTLDIRRPGEARAFALLLFAVNWMLAHASLAYMFLIWKLKDTNKVLKYLAFVAVSLLLIPKMREAMPDAPGYDGVLIGEQSLTLFVKNATPIHSTPSR
ncbi:hypothetical protein NLI96_g8140 [Meripilus lineatus]|uniref:Uncharacterized protein n=1 Tax=Meripilus lineatus TaxID=2056292 RepID=A0AAD5YGH7_9APHY|nr:hypothetical protein NLI96_g8140 [Physisporinus lineatus]